MRDDARLPSVIRPARGLLEGPTLEVRRRDEAGRPPVGPVDREPAFDSTIPQTSPSACEEACNPPVAILAPPFDPPEVQPDESTALGPAPTRRDPTGRVAEPAGRETPLDPFGIGSGEEPHRSGDGEIPVKGARRTMDDPE